MGRENSFLHPQWPEPFSKFCSDISFPKSETFLHMSWSIIQREFTCSSFIIIILAVAPFSRYTIWEIRQKHFWYTIVLGFGSSLDWIISQFLYWNYYKRNSWKNKLSCLIWIYLVSSKKNYLTREQKSANVTAEVNI